MKKPAVIFFVLSVYIISAFAWWTYAHIKNAKLLHNAQAEWLTTLPYKATLDIRENVEQELFIDTTALKNYFYNNYPQLLIRFNDGIDPLNNYTILHNGIASAEIEKSYKRKMWMYGLEGLVMVLLLFWGIGWIYKSLQNRLNLKKQQSNFLLSITHELKTPLASIKLYIETLLKRNNLEKEQTEKMLNNALVDVTRLRDLVENLLLAAQLDTHKFELAYSNFNISEALALWVDKFALPRNLKNRLQLFISPNIHLTADAIALEMVVINLLSNAVKYSPETGTVTIALTEEGSQIKITVTDEGKGIATNDKENLFAKFYRAEDESIRKTKGTGLGLFIVKNLLDLHNATILVSNNSPSGTVFEILIPKHAK